MTRKRRLIAYLMVLTLTVATLAGCTGATTTPTPADGTPSESTASNDTTSEAPAPPAAEILPMRYYMPGGPTPQADMVNEAISAKLQADGLAIDFQPRYTPWDQWVNKINIALSSGEEFELLHIMEDYITTSMYTSQGGLTPLDDLIAQHTPGMWDLFDSVLWDSAKVGAATMTVPAFWRDNSGDMEGALTYSKTNFEKYNLQIPKNLEEMIAVNKVLQEKQQEDTGIKSYMYEHSLTRCPVALHRAYDSWPFYASQDGIYKVTQDGKASLFFESEEFKMNCEFMNESYKLGLIHPDILNLPADTIRANKEAGDTLINLMTGGGDVMSEDGTTVVNDFEKFFLNEDRPFLMNLPLLNSNAIPSTTAHPELGLQFLYWMYSEKGNQDLVLYGIEGTHWNPVGEDEFERIKDENNANLYAFDMWMIEYVPNHRFDVKRTTSEADDLDYMTNVRADNTVESPVIGFNFNSEPVAVELANMMAEYTTSMLPIKLGVISYEENFDEALSKMKAAGCDKVINEYQVQLTAYLANK